MDNHQDLYLSLRDKVMDYLKAPDGQTHKYADYVLMLPDFFHLLYHLALEENVDSGEKVKLGLALAYFVSPIDVLPEGLFGPLGLIDDLAVAAVVLNHVMNTIDPAIIRRHWVGSGDALEQVQMVISSADQMIGTGAWNKIKEWFNSQDHNNR